MAEELNYFTLTNNLIYGSNGPNLTRINLSENPTGPAVIGLEYSTTTLGYEILPNPADGGVLRYRYTTDNTNTFLWFDSLGQGTLSTQTGEFNNLITNTFTSDSIETHTLNIKAKDNSFSGLSLLTETGLGGYIALNNTTGSTRLASFVDKVTSRPVIQFYQDNCGTVGTRIEQDYISTYSIVTNKLEASRITLHATDNAAITANLFLSSTKDLYIDNRLISATGPTGIQGPIGPVGLQGPMKTGTFFFSQDQHYLAGPNTLIFNNSGVRNLDPSLSYNQMNGRVYNYGSTNYVLKINAVVFLQTQTSVTFQIIDSNGIIQASQKAIER